MRWLYSDDGVIPYFNPTQLGHCVDQVTLEQAIVLWKTLVKLIDERGQPLPPAKHIMPTLVAL
ncbi:hypothetical protein GQ600_1560 [Phytophthora cactorum]|nr:hypothetical protein GQ600_1560 [Phytophthora cactorum]